MEEILCLPVSDILYNDTSLATTPRSLVKNASLHTTEQPKQLGDFTGNTAAPAGPPCLQR